MSVTQERLMSIIDAADHMVQKHRELLKMLRSMALAEPVEMLKYHEQLPGLLMVHSIDEAKHELLQKEIAHFKVHFKRNDRRKLLKRIQRENRSGGKVAEDMILDNYFNPRQDLEPELQKDHPCPLCGVRALPNERELHKEDCHFYISEAAGLVEVERQYEEKYGKIEEGETGTL